MQAAVLVDLQAAFPSLGHEFLFEVLQRQGVPDFFLTGIRAFYKNNFGKEIGKPNILVIMLLFGNDYTELVKPCVVRKIEYCKK